ncbi:MAG: hypothetical protein IPJ82_10520 [Lewinellaceae bacterium]|nr:hypothetical protein [Lewinellaceae bacterium]
MIKIGKFNWSAAFTRSLIFTAWGLTFVFVSSIGCGRESMEEPAEYRSATDITLNWNQLLLELERKTPGYRPPVSARMFAYVEMSAYEAALPGLGGYNSMESFCDGYVKPAFNHPTGQFYLPASVNAAYAAVLHHFFSSAPVSLQSRIDRLEAEHTASFPKQVNPAVIRQSAEFGSTVAKTIWQWSQTDTQGHAGHLKNYDPAYTIPVCAGCWHRPVLQIPARFCRTGAIPGHLSSIPATCRLKPRSVSTWNRGRRFIPKRWRFFLFPSRCRKKITGSPNCGAMTYPA